MLLAGLWCSSLGYGNKELIDAIATQLNTLSYSHMFGGRTHQVGMDLADKLAAMLPIKNAKIFFANSGSEANDSHIKLLHYYFNVTGKTTKKKIIALERSYHGVTLASAALTGLPANHQHFDIPLKALGILRADLDLAAPNNPVILTRAGAHSAAVNSLALSLANIDNTTPDPEGGVIERDDTGAANGIIRERHGMVEALVPDATYEELLASLEVNLNALLAMGITSITDASTPVRDYAMWEELYANQDAKKLPRAAVQFQWRNPAAINELKARVGNGSDRLRIGPPLSWLLIHYPMH